jgi:flagellar motor switch protein FliN/FliY
MNNVETVHVVELPQLSAETAQSGARVGTRLELVEHLKVGVTVVVGTAEVPASALFALGVGDVLPLAESVDQPVEVWAGDKVVARGVLVAAGDQLGVRITEIAPP